MRSLALLGFVFLCAGQAGFCQTATGVTNLGNGSGLGMYKARRLAEVLPYDPARAAETHLVMQRLGQLSLGPLFNRTLAVMGSGFAPELPTLDLIDHDNDLHPDFFVYNTPEGPSDLYGAFFPLTEGGSAAWVVFPVGPAFDEDFNFLFIFNHWVDQNEDGEVDLIILEGVDLDGNGQLDAGLSAWLIDRDFDGLFETALHCSGLECSDIAPTGGAFDLRLFISPGDESRFDVNAPLPGAEFYRILFADLRQSLEEDR